MDVTAVVLYQGALAYYTVSRQGDGKYVAHLLNYSKGQELEPPQTIHFWNNGRHCSGNIEDDNLMDEIWLAVKDKFKDGDGSDFSATNLTKLYVFI
ncbi:MAG: hypothetical protein C4329_03160 [Chitinophagaceae bacterium]